MPTMKMGITIMWVLVGLGLLMIGELKTIVRATFIKNCSTIWGFGTCYRIDNRIYWNFVARISYVGCGPFAKEYGYCHR